MRTVAIFRHVAGAALEALLVSALILSGILTLAALGSEASGLGGVRETYAVRAWIAVGEASFGSGVMATVSAEPEAGPRGSKKAATTDVWVRARCHQAGTLVYFEAVKAEPDGTAWLQLGPTDRWTGGGATCQAESGHYDKFLRWKQLASTEFAVAP